MVNPDVDCYTKPVITKKYPEKCKQQQPAENQKNTETEI